MFAVNIVANGQYRLFVRQWFLIFSVYGTRRDQRGLFYCLEAFHEELVTQDDNGRTVDGC